MSPYDHGASGSIAQPLPLRRAGDGDAPDEVGDEVGKGVDQSDQVTDNSGRDGDSATVRSPDPDPHEELAEGCAHRRFRQGHVGEPSDHGDEERNAGELRAEGAV